MRITYDTLNEYVIVPVKNMLNGVNCVSDNAVKNLYALCVLFYGSLEFLDLELRPFKSWNVDNPGMAFLVKDIEEYTFNVPERINIILMDMAISEYNANTNEYIKEYFEKIIIAHAEELQSHLNNLINKLKEDING